MILAIDVHYSEDGATAADRLAKEEISPPS